MLIADVAVPVPDVPVVDTMGPRGGAIHSSDEFLIVDSLAERAQLSALTMMRIAERGTV